MYLAWGRKGSDGTFDERDDSGNDHQEEPHANESSKTPQRIIRKYSLTLKKKTTHYTLVIISKNMIWKSIKIKIKCNSVYSVYTKSWLTHFYQKWYTKERLFLYISDLEGMLFY